MKILKDLYGDQTQKQREILLQEITYEAEKLYPPDIYPNGPEYGVPYPQFLRIMEAYRFGDYPEGYVPFKTWK